MTIRNARAFLALKTALRGLQCFVGKRSARAFLALKRSCEVCSSPLQRHLAGLVSGPKIHRAPWEGLGRVEAWACSPARFAVAAPFRAKNSPRSLGGTWSSRRAKRSCEVCSSGTSQASFQGQKFTALLGRKWSSRSAGLKSCEVCGSPLQRHLAGLVSGSKIHRAPSGRSWSRRSADLKVLRGLQ